MWEGINAIENIIDFYNDISLIFTTEPCGDTNHWHNTINLGKIEGGTKVNIVPDYCYAEIDIRFTEPWTVEKMKEVDYIIYQMKIILIIMFLLV